MRGPGINAAALCVCGLAREVARLWNIETRPPGPAAAKRRGRRRALSVEPLECRHLLDAGGADALISALWFQDVSQETAAAHAGAADWSVESYAAAGDQAAVEAGQSGLYDWIVQFDTAAVAGFSSVAQTASLLAGGGIEFEVVRGLGLVGQVLVRSSDASLDAVENWLAENLYVAAFEQDAAGRFELAVPSDPLYNQLWGFSAIDAPEAWSVSTGSSSVVVAVIDTGVDYNHVDLAANVWTNPGEIPGNGIDDDRNGFVDDVHGFDFVNNDGNPMDDNGHGTHVSGTIAAAANNGTGVAGLNWSSSVMALKFLDAEGSGYLSDAVRAINYATMMRTQYGVNVRVMNNSWGGGDYSSSLFAAIQAGNNADILFVVAAGNDGTNNDLSPQYPANYNCQNVISVAAVAQSGQLAGFSCYGAATVDLAAPGVSIYSTVPGNFYAAYSGTSMAAPHVSGVAALAFALAPDASAAEVRAAILDGVEHSSALAGKTASGGTLNAYNTLQLLDVRLHGPAVAALAASPASVAAGQSVTLTASGVSDDSGTIIGVYFYRDSNGNGQFDAADATVGSTSTVNNGSASIAVGTAGLAAGTHRFFVRAANNHSQYSSAVGTTITVLPADDHGDSAAAATAVGIPSATAATLGAPGDADWFKFQAAAGKSYVFAVQLGTLADSTLSLYAGNGVTQLAYNDDAGSGTTASRIAWTAASSGTYYLAVAGYGGNYAGTYTLSVQAENAAPVLAPIADQTMSRNQTTLSITVGAADADGDKLSFSAVALAVDPLAQLAYDLDQEFGLYQWQGSFWTNLRGANEKYIASTTNGVYEPFFILPNGKLYCWGGSIAASRYVATLSAEYYADPFLLCDAQPPEYAAAAASDVRASISGGVLTVVRAADYVADFRVRVSVSDGAASDNETFHVSVNNSAPVLSAIADQTMSRGQTTLAVPVGATDADGDKLSFSAVALAVDPLAQLAYDLDQEYGLYQWQGSFWTNLRGANEKYIASSTNGVYEPFFILPNGELYCWSGSIAASRYVATLSAKYYADPFLLCDAQVPEYAAAAAGDVRVSISDGLLTIVRAADFAGDFQVRVNVSDGAASDSDTFAVSVNNSAPALAPIGDQTLARGQTTLTVSVSASDAEGDALSFSAETLKVDPAAQLAYDLDREFGLYQWQGSFWTNLRGANEKYIASATNGVYEPFFILPNGELYCWGGSIAESEYVATLSAEYYADPFLLCDAQPPALVSFGSSAVAASMAGNLLTVRRDPGYAGEFFVRVNVSDGELRDSETFRVSAAPAPSAAPVDALTAALHDDFFDRLSRDTGLITGGRRR